MSFTQYIGLTQSNDVGVFYAIRGSNFVSRSCMLTKRRSSAQTNIPHETFFAEYMLEYSLKIAKKADPEEVKSLATQYWIEADSPPEGRKVEIYKDKYNIRNYHFDDLAKPMGQLYLDKYDIFAGKIKKTCIPLSNHYKGIHGELPIYQEMGPSFTPAKRYGLSSGMQYTTVTGMTSFAT